MIHDFMHHFSSKSSKTRHLKIPNRGQNFPKKGLLEGGGRPIGFGPAWIVVFGSPFVGLKSTVIALRLHATSLGWIR